MDAYIHLARGKPAFVDHMRQQNFTEDTDPKLVMKAWSACAKPQYLISLELVSIHSIPWEIVFNSKMSWEEATAQTIQYRTALDDIATGQRAALGEQQQQRNEDEQQPQRQRQRQNGNAQNAPAQPPVLNLAEAR